MTVRQRHPFDVELSSNIAIARGEAGLTQRAVAETIGMHENQYQRLERGVHRVTAYDLARIAGAIGVSVATLFPDIQ
jgi:transcriptional regulator with XRE-family HTH domain